MVNVNGRPKPELVIIDGKPRRSTCGTFYLDWRENGQRRTRSVGILPREALDAWQLQSGIDIKTLQTLLGHKNIATTEKHLKSLRPAVIAHLTPAASP